MRVRRGYWFIPALAILGTLLALYLFFHTKEEQVQPPLPGAPAVTPIAPPLPAPAKASSDSAVSVTEPARAVTATAKKPFPLALTPEQIEAIRTEMKVSLAAMYGAEKSYFSEYGRYTTDFNQLGYSPERREINIKTGFVAAYQPENPLKTEDPRFMSFDEFFSEYPPKGGQDPLKFSPSAEGFRLADVSRFCRQGCTASESGFEIISASNLDGDPDLDVWTINEKKELVHAFDDLAPTQ